MNNQVCFQLNILNREAGENADPYVSKTLAKMLYFRMKMYPVQRPV
jgi:hypothetical protein